MCPEKHGRVQMFMDPYERARAEYLANSTNPEICGDCPHIFNGMGETPCTYDERTNTCSRINK